ncbi:MAG: hypothetical protein JWM44_2459 [Bacilli bacterium]|nr:hypothetical protein [Bacilli bacterium]
MKKQKGMLIALILVFLLGGCGGKIETKSPKISTTLPPASNLYTIAPPSQSPSSSPSSSPVSSDKPVPPEKNPTGDISDSQVFINYSSVKGGYSLEVPEGWARKEQEAAVDFADKLDGVKVAVESATQAPSVDSIKGTQIVEMTKTGRAIKIDRIQEVSLSQEKAIKVSYSSNSEADSVTGKQVRLDNESYYFYKNGKLAVLTMWAPLGADNIDQWDKMSKSFRWDIK